MFYSYDILNPRQGKLAVVWLVATGRFKYHRRQDKNFKDVIAVKVHNTCDEILRYVLRGGGRVEGRFSLYLSSMLMFGTVKVYRRQIVYLLDQAMEAFERLQRQHAVMMLDLDIPVTKKTRVTVKPMTEGLVTLGLTPTPRRDLITPRRRRTDDDQVTPLAGRPETEAEELRRRSITEPEGDILAMLQTDWIEESPIHVRPQDITMREEDLLGTSLRLAEERRELERSVGPLDLGPCFSTWEGPIAEQPPHPTLEGIRKSSSLDEAEAEMRARDARRVEELEVTPLAPPVPAEEQPVPAEEQPVPAEEQPVPAEPAPQETLPTEGTEMVVQPPVEETPAHQAPEPQAELVRKGAAPAPAEDQTPVVPAEAPPPRAVDTAQLELHPVEAGEPGPRRKRRRRLIVDQEIFIPTEVIRAQTRDWSATMRVRTASEDVIHAQWFRWMVPAQQLLSQVRHRRPLANPLTRLLTRHHRADPAQEHWDFRPSARRQLQLVDESREEARAGISQLSMDVSGLTDASALQISHLEVSSSRSIHLTPQTAQLEAAVPPAVIQDPTQLLPIEEEQGLEIIPPMEGVREQVSAEETSVAVPVPQEDQQRPEGQLVEGPPRPLRTPEETPVRRERPGVKKPRVDEEIHLATPIESRRRHERVSSYVPPDTTPPRGPPRSPEGGANIVSLEAEVHQQPRKTRDVARAVPPPATPEEAPRVPTAMPPSGTQEFEVMPQVPALFEETYAPEGVSMPEPVEQQPLEEPVAQEPVDMPGPHAPPGPLDTSEVFIPSFISPVRHLSPISRSYQETEKELTTLFPSRTQTTFADLLPKNATRLEAAHMFSVLLEMHKKRIVRMEQENSYTTIYVTWL